MLFDLKLIYLHCLGSMLVSLLLLLHGVDFEVLFYLSLLYTLLYIICPLGPVPLIFPGIRDIDGVEY